MPELRMPVGGVTPPMPSSNQVSLYVKADKRFYMQDDMGTEVKLLTDETTIASLSTQLPLTDTGGANPTIAINNVTAISNGAMLATDKVILDAATPLNVVNQLVKRDALGNFTANEITAASFVGPSSTCVTIPALIGEVTTDGITNATVIANNVINDDNVAAGAAIALTKLAVDPRLRSTHSGTQLASSISDFGSAVDSHLTSTAPIVNAMVDASAGIDVTKLSVNPTLRSTHSGTQTASTISDFTSASNTAIGNYLTSNPITNAQIDGAANIDISKLAVDPRARATHTGTQLASTISDFTTSVQGVLVEGDGINITGGTIEVDGTLNRIDVSGGSVDIASTYVGQSSITTLGTVGTGTWNGDVVSVLYGGTGKTNAGAAANALLDVNDENTSIILTEDNQFIIMDATAAVRTVTLPAISGDTYKFYVKKIDNSNNVVVSASGGDTIEGSASYTLTTQYQYVILTSNPADNVWYIFGSN